MKFYRNFMLVCVFYVNYVLSNPLNQTNDTLTCPQFENIKNAQVVLFNHENLLNFKVFHVKCDPGYELIGRPKIICNNGVWEPKERPRCISRCEPPPFIHNGHLEIDGQKDETGLYNKGALVTYTCNKDFKLFPPESKYRVCEMGIWTGTPAACIRVYTSTVRGCKYPKDIANGYFVIEKANLEHTFDVGQRIHYSCNRGYSLTEPSSQQCLEDGSWSPKFQPSCIKLDEEDRRCGPVYTGEYTTTDVIRGALSLDRDALLGTELEVRCQRGYHDQSNFCSPAILQCVAPGIWKGQPPTCVPVNSCAPPPHVDNAAMFNYGLHMEPQTDDGLNIHPDDINNDIIDEDNEIDGQAMGIQTRYPFGAQVAYKCLPGYKIRGDFILTCYKSGCWHPNIRPECDPDGSFIDRTLMSTKSFTLIAVLFMTASLLGILLICGHLLYRHRKSLFYTERRSVSANAASTLPMAPGFTPVDSSSSTLLHDPDRLALIAYADGMQSGLPTYEEAIRDRNSNGVGNVLCRPPQRPHWTNLTSNRRARGQTADANRQVGCNSHTTNLRNGSTNLSGVDPMGSTDTMTTSEVSTNITLDTVSSHTCSSGSQVASCRAICGSLASFDTSSVVNTEGVPLLEECEQEEAPTSLPAGNLVREHPPVTSAADNVSFKFHQASPDLV